MVGRLRNGNLWSKGEFRFFGAGSITSKSDRETFSNIREGEYTRGMCVVDRRNNKKAGHGSKFGKSMAELENDEESHQQEAAPIQVDKPSQADLNEEKGINVVTQTPGSEALVERMLKDIWGA